jgi:hypothetical protein
MPVAIVRISILVAASACTTGSLPYSAGEFGVGSAKAGVKDVYMDTFTVVLDRVPSVQGQARLIEAIKTAECVCRVNQLSKHNMNLGMKSKAYCEQRWLALQIRVKNCCAYRAGFESNEKEEIKTCRMQTGNSLPTQTTARLSDRFRERRTIHCCFFCGSHRHLFQLSNRIRYSSQHG